MNVRVLSDVYVCILPNKRFLFISSVIDRDKLVTRISWLALLRPVFIAEAIRPPTFRDVTTFSLSVSLSLSLSLSAAFLRVK